MSYIDSCSLLLCIPTCDEEEEEEEEEEGEVEGISEQENVVLCGRGKYHVAIIL